MLWNMFLLWAPAANFYQRLVLTSFQKVVISPARLISMLQPSMKTIVSSTVTLLCQCNLTKCPWLEGAFLYRDYYTVMSYILASRVGIWKWVLDTGTFSTRPIYIYIYIMIPKYPNLVPRCSLPATDEGEVNLRSWKLAVWRQEFAP